MELVDIKSQSEFENSVWRQSSKGKWLMNFNNKQQCLEEISKLSLDLSNKRPLSVGSLVMTPKGIGRLLKIEEGRARVKFLKNEEEENFERSTVSNEFNIYIKILNADCSSWYRITVPSNGTTEMIKKSIEDMKMVDMEAFNYVLIYQGKELADNLFFDQLDFKPNSKILMSGCKMYPYKLTK
jgi:hypothetical protein